MPNSRKPGRTIASRLGLKKGEDFSKKERKLIAKGVPVEVLSQRRKFRRLLRGKTGDSLRKNYGELERTDKIGFWETSRGYADHADLFSPFLPKPLTETLVEIGKNAKRPLKILDEGAGTGFFLSRLKQHLSSHGIATKTTALSLTQNPELMQKFRERLIDRVGIGKAEEFVPREKQHVIFGLYAATAYAPRQAAKELLLKHCHSLEKGGLILLGLDMKDSSEEYSSEEFKNRVKQTLKKRGFEITFHKTRKELLKKKSFPPDVLILKRMR